MIADLDTRRGELYASGAEVLPCRPADSGGAAAVASAGRDDHLALRAMREQRVDQVVGDEGVASGRVEARHPGRLKLCSGVTVGRLAYRAPGYPNLHPADAALNLPVERHSHGLRRLAALEAARGSFSDAVEAIWRQTGQRLGACRLRELAQLAAADFEDFSRPGDQHPPAQRISW